MQKKVKLVSTIYFIVNLIISGCVSNDINKSIDYTRQSNSYKHATNILAGITSVTQNLDKQEMLLSAAESYIEANLFIKANNILDKIESNYLNTKQQDRLKLIEAKIYINNNQSEKALTKLGAIKSEEPNNSHNIKDQKEELSKIAINKLQLDSKPQTRIDGYQNETPEVTISELNNRIKLYQAISNDDELTYQNNINLWGKIITQDKQSLDTRIRKLKDQNENIQLDEEKNTYDKVLEQKNYNNTLLGWLELGSITKSNKTESLNKFKNKITSWKNKYPHHPAIKFFANMSNDYQDEQFYDSKIKKVVMLLPLTGNLAPAAKAIKEGILTGYYNDKNFSKAELKFIDTANDVNNIEKYYNQAIKENPDLIIGPLNKTAVEKVISMHKTTTPLIALNYTSEQTISNTLSDTQINAFQFGISGEDEAEQAARKIWQSDLNNTLIIVDNNEWGKRVSNSFKTKFEELGGNIANISYLNNDTDLKKFIYSSLGIDESQKRKNVLQWIVGDKIAFQPRYRKDFDNIFLVTSSLKAKQIKPILKFYYADNIPIIATSNILEFKHHSKNIKDLSSIQICDIPLVIHNNNENKNTISLLAKSWPSNYENLIRLYALGMDSYNMIYSIGKLKDYPNMGVMAYSGHLTLSNQNKITRTLPWATIVDNEIKMQGTL